MVYYLAITFIRHGMTPENEARRYIGHTDVPLAGQEKTRLLQADLQFFKPVDLLVSSDLLRCRQTCERLFRNYCGAKCEMEQWREINFGDWEGKTFPELKEIKEYQQWLHSPFSVAPPIGESYKAFCRRVEAAPEQTIILAEQTNIMDKRFYIVVPYEPRPDMQKALAQSKNFITGLLNLFDTKERRVVIDEADLEKAKEELRNRVQAVMQGLMQCNIQALPLDTQELIELYYNTYNPDTATRQQLKNFDELTADIVTKGEGFTPQPNIQGGMQ